VIDALSQRLWWLVSGAPDATPGNRLLLIALVACSLFATGQLLTMLATRWGDRNAMSKSFFLSVLVHLCLGLGWATIVDKFPPASPSLARETEQSVPIKGILTETEERLSQPEPGNTPIWQQPLSIPTPDLTRVERDASMAESPEFTRSELTAMEREASPERPTSLAPVPAPELLAVSTTATEPETTPEVSPTEPSPAPAEPAETPTPQAELVARADTGPVAAMPTRQMAHRTATADLFVDAVPTRASAQRAAPQPDELEFSIPLPLEQTPTVPRPVGATSDTIARKASPAAAPTAEPQLAASSASSGAVTDTPRFTRSFNTRSATGNVASSVARRDADHARFDGSRERLSSARQSLGSPLESDAQPTVIRPAPTDNRAPAAAADAATTYRLRRIERRREIALRNGGTEASEQAVEDALAWLARHQEAEGYWDADKHGGGQREVRNIDKDKPPGGTETDTGLTGLAILSFLGAGHTHEEGHYTDEVSRAIRWLIARQRSDGYLGGRATYYDQMYCHAIAAYALAEAYGMQHEADAMSGLRESVAKAVWYITQTQNADGGWRYRVGASDSDMSMFGWQLMALKSAQLAGVDVPDETRRGLIQFLRSRSRGSNGGLAGYKEDSKVTPAMTAEALFCKQMYGLKRSSPSSREAVEYLADHLPRLSQPDEYYWYYGTLAMFQYGGEPWQRWNQSLRDTLIRLQRTSGDHAGSWDPVGPWGSVGGRVYSTTFCVLSLEVYYRFLPLYQVGEE